MNPWLVVEDDDDIRNIVKILFTTWGHVPVEFRDGHRATKWLDEVDSGSFDGTLPDLALMDIRMPGPRGNEIARRMRSMKQFRSIPIVLMTAFKLEPDELQRFIDQDGVDRIIHKPLPDLFELKQMLDDLHAQKTS